MARNENPPFPRGTTWGGGATVASTDGAQYAGKSYVFEDSADRAIGSFRSNRFVTCRIVRNNSGGTLTAPAKKLCIMDLGGGTVADAGSNVSNFTTSSADKGYPADEYLTGNVLANDLFYIVTDGPAKCITDASGSTNIAVGGVVVPGASGTNVGGVVAQGSITLNQLQNAIGKAMEAVNATSHDITIDVGGHIR